MRRKRVLSGFGLVVVASVAVVMLAASVSFAIGQTWKISSSSGRTARGVFTNDSRATVTGVSLQASPNNPVTSFVFAGRTCAPDSRGDVACATGVSIAPNKTATFHFATKKKFTGGVRGCYTAASAAPPSNNPPPSNSPPPSQNHLPPAHCDAIQFQARAPALTHPKPTTKVKTRLRLLIGQAITDELKAIADLKARHTTLARGALIKSVAKLQAAQNAGSSYDLNSANLDVARALGVDRTMLASYTESINPAKLAFAKRALANAVASNRAALKILRALK